MTRRLTWDDFRRLVRGRSASSSSLPKPAKPRKYRNVPTTVDGVRFDSKREAQRWRELRMLLKAGEIQALARQVEFLLPGGIIYRADFGYRRKGVPVVEDVKGVRTKEYKLKARLMSSIGYPIMEV